MNQQLPTVPGNPPFVSPPPSFFSPTAPQESMIQPKASSENTSDQQKPETLLNQSSITPSNQSSTVPPNPNMFMYYPPFPGSFQNYR